MANVLVVIILTCFAIFGDARLCAADAPAAAAATLGGNAQPAVNQGYLDKALVVAGMLADACKAGGAASGVAGRLGGLGGGGGAAKPDLLGQALALKGDLQSLRDNKTIAADGAFARLVLNGKNGIASTFKGIPGADTFQSAFADGGIATSLIAATPVDLVPGYAKSLEVLSQVK